MPPLPRLLSLCRTGLHLLAVILLSAAVAGCKLWEPPRYPRLELPAGAPRLRVLFIGNSMTYYNDLPGLVQQLSVGEPAPVDFQAVTRPLGSLEYHWSMTSAKPRLQREHWDYVILQDYSTRPVSNFRNSLKYFQLFVDEARRAGAQPIIFQNWTRWGRSKDYAAMKAAYRQIQQATGSTLAPIGTAWRIAETNRPGLKLLVDDRHPTDAGTYLTGCVLYEVLYQKDCRTLPATLLGPTLPPLQVEYLRQCAHDAVEEAARGQTP